MSVWQVHHQLKKNQHPLCCPLFPSKYFNPQDRINKMVNQDSIDYHTSPSRLISKIGENFWIYGIPITGKMHFWVKNWIYTFLLIPLFTHRLVLSPLRQRKITLSSQARSFWRSILPSLKKGDYIFIFCMKMKIQELNYLII